MKKIAIAAIILAVALLLTAVVLMLAPRTGKPTGTSGTSQGTTETTQGAVTPEMPEPTDESYFDFEYVSTKLANGEYDEYYKISPKSVENLPEVLIIPPEYKGVEVVFLQAESFAGAKIKKLFLPGSLRNINKKAFYDCTELEEVYFYSEYSEKGTVIIGNNAFEGCTSLRTLQFYGDIGVSVEEDAFNGCISLESTNVIELSEKIDAGAFENCISLKQANLSASAGMISISAFRGCKDITVTLAEGNEYIEAKGNALVSKRDSSLIWLKSIEDIPTDGSVTYIESFYFLEDFGITEYTIPDFIKVIGEGAFEDCKSLREITISAELKIPNNAFSGLENLERVVFKTNMINIAYNAFENCTGLREIIWAEGATMVRSFNDCTALTEVIIPDGVTVVRNAFNNCTSVANITVPGSTTNIRYSFDGCTSLSEIIVPQGVEVIEGSFNYCTKLQKVTLPKSLSHIEFAFAECPYLRDIYYEGTVEEWKAIIKDNFEGQLTVHCTDGDVKMFIE